MKTVCFNPKSEEVQNIVKASGLSFFQVHFLLSNYWQNKEQLGSVLPEREVLQNLIRSGYKEFKKSTMPLTVIEAINSLYPAPTQAAPIEVQREEPIIQQSTPSAKGKMTFSYGNNKRNDVTSNTTLEAIKNGERTATTRYESDGHIEYWKNLKVGDIIEWEGQNEEKVLVEVTKPLHKLVGSGKTAEQWSKLEGWSTDYFNSKVRPKLNEAWQIEYKLVIPNNPSNQNPSLQKDNLATFINHSGGAVGADTQWDIIGKEFGMINNKHYYFEGFKTPNGNTSIPINLKNEADSKLKATNKTLGRTFPTSNEYVNNLLRRNWWQVKNSDAIFAISSITDNKVDGGTGWAVHMAIAENKPVYVFDQNQNKWFTWNNGKFIETTTPVLTKNFAGIGTREINEKGKQAIRNVYSKTSSPSNNTINIFAGANENADLSNFAIRPFTIELHTDKYGPKAFTFQSVEQAFHFFKTMLVNNPQVGKKILQTTNGRELRRLTSRENLPMTPEQVKEWDSNSSQVMEDLIYTSFDQNPAAVKRLVGTGDSIITHKQDTTKWKTEFPRILMKVRELFKTSYTEYTVLNFPKEKPQETNNPQDLQQKQQTVETHRSDPHTSKNKLVSPDQFIENTTYDIGNGQTGIFVGYRFARVDNSEKSKVEIAVFNVNNVNIFRAVNGGKNYDINIWNKPLAITKADAKLYNVIPYSDLTINPQINEESFTLKSTSNTQENNKVEIISSTYTRQSVQNDSDSMYLFTDNAQRTSRPTATTENVDKNGWYYKKYKSQTNKPIHFGSLNNPSSAVMRGLNNAYPISTMSAFGTDWTDANFDLFKTTIDDEIAQIKKDLPKFSKIKIGNFRIGQGGKFASLPERHQAYLDSKLLEIGIDNTGDKPKIINNKTTDTPVKISDQETINISTSINENEVLYQLPQGREQEEFVASEKTIRDLAARMSNSDLFQNVDNSSPFEKLTYSEQQKLTKKIKDISEKQGDRIGIRNYDVYDFLIKQNRHNEAQEYKKNSLYLYKIINNKDEKYKGVTRVSNGIIYINLAYATLDTPIHEILGHPIIRAIKQRVGSNTLYQNLLKELEYGKGKEILDRVKRDYPIINEAKLRENMLSYLDERALNKVKSIVSYSITKHNTYAVNVIKEDGSTFTHVISVSDVGRLFTKEEQQEEAIVELLGLMTAEKLDKVKDGKLISLLKRLLKEVKAFVRDLLSQREVEIDKLPDNMTLGDIANLLAYSNSKLILPGSEVVYTTPDNQQFKTYQEASNHISQLAKSAEDVDLVDLAVNISIENIDKEIETLQKELDNFKFEIEPFNKFVDVYTNKGRLRQNYWARKKDGTTGWTGGAKETLLEPEYDGFVLDTDRGDGRFITKISDEEAEKLYYAQENKFNITTKASREKYAELETKIHNLKNNSLKGFIEKNKEYEQVKEIIEKWIRVNNIQYNPEEVYSRGQEFVSVLGAYSDFDINLMMQNILQHIEDNQKAGGEFTISAFTKPIDEKINHLEGNGGKIKFKIYPQSQDIKWAANTDVFSGSVWDASEKVNKDKQSELLGVSYTKYPSLRIVDAVQPNLANIIDNLAHHHNELGISLTGSNFRLEYDEDVPYTTKKLIDSVNSILDQKYGKLIKPEIKKRGEIIVQYGLFSKEAGAILDWFDTKEEAQAQVDKVNEQLKNLGEPADYSIKPITKSMGIQPTQTKETLKESIDSVRSKLGIAENTYILEDAINELERLKTFFVKASVGAKDFSIVDHFYGYRGTFKTREEAEKALADLISKQQEIIDKYSKQKEYTSQALVNIIVAKLKEVAKKYPRSLIRSEVRPINSNSNLGFTKNESPFQKVSNDSFQQSQQKFAEGNKDEKYQQIEKLFEENPELANQVYKVLEFNNYELTMDSFMPKKHWKIGHIIDNPTEAANICDNTQIRVLNYILDKFGKPKEKGTFYAKPVTIWAKSPINDKQIHHYTVAVRVNNKVYLYDMPQSEYIEYVSENKGKVIKEYRPRLIEYTPTNLQFYYGTSNENLHIQDEVILTSDLINLNQLTSQQKQQAIELYSQYLDTIFPESKVKKIVYHATNASIEFFDKAKISNNTLNYGFYGKGFYFNETKDDLINWWRTLYKKDPNIVASIINTKNPYKNDSSIIEENTKLGSKKETEEFTNNLISQKYDSVLPQIPKEQGSNEYVVFEPEQIHILGSNQDIEGFKNYVNNKSKDSPIFVVDSSAIDTALGNVIESNGEAKKYNDNLKECM